MEGRLRECPFCGNGWSERDVGVFILWHKPTCMFGGPNGVVHKTRMNESFVIKWNTRATDTLIDEMAEALKWAESKLEEASQAGYPCSGAIEIVGQAQQEYQERKE